MCCIHSALTGSEQNCLEGKGKNANRGDLVVIKKELKYWVFVWPSSFAAGLLCIHLQLLVLFHLKCLKCILLKPYKTGDSAHVVGCHHSSLKPTNVFICVGVWWELGFESLRDSSLVVVSKDDDDPKQETLSNGIEWWLQPSGRLCPSLSVMSSVMARLLQHLMTQKRPPLWVCGHPLLYILSLTSLAGVLHNYCTIYKQSHSHEALARLARHKTIFFSSYPISCLNVQLHQHSKLESID